MDLESALAAFRKKWRENTRMIVYPGKPLPEGWIAEGAFAGTAKSGRIDSFPVTGLRQAGKGKLVSPWLKIDKPWLLIQLEGSLINSTPECTPAGVRGSGA